MKDKGIVAIVETCDIQTQTAGPRKKAYYKNEVAAKIDTNL